MIKRMTNFRSRALRSNLEFSTDSQHKSKDEESSSPLISSSGTSDYADKYSQEKIKVTPSSATESDNISGLASIGNSSAKDTKTPDLFSIEIPNKYISSLPYITRQLNRKIWQGYQGSYRVS